MQKDKTAPSGPAGRLDVRPDRSYLIPEVPPAVSRRALLTAILILAALIGVGFLFLVDLASSRTRLTRLGWERTLGSRDDILRRFPAAEASDAAIELERLVFPLGIDVAPRDFEDRERPSQEQVQAFRRFKRELGGYVDRQIEQAERRRLDPPPEALVDYLELHDERLEAVRRHLTGDETVRWEMAVEKLQAAPVPNLVGLLELHKLLVADALVRAGGGDSAGALVDLDASWRLNRALVKRPNLMTQQIAITVTRFQSGALRLIEDVPELWIERLGEHDFHGSVLMAMKMEGWLWAQIPEGIYRDDNLRGLKRLWERVAKPYTALCFADLSDVYRRELERRIGRRSLCDSRGPDLRVRPARWNMLGNFVNKEDFTYPLHRLARLELDLELTRKLIEVEAARRGNGGRWAPEVSGIEESEACPDDRWLYEVGPDGSMSLALSREVSWPDARGLILPTRFAAEPAVKLPVSKLEGKP